MHGPVVGLTFSGAIVSLLALRTPPDYEVCSRHTTAITLGRFSEVGYSLPRGGNPLPFNGPSLDGLVPLILQPARKCSLLPQ